jgi:hypothetical protein
MMRSSTAYDGMLPVGTVYHGWLVLRGFDVVAEGFGSNADAWNWIDRHSYEGRGDFDRYHRIRTAFSYAGTATAAAASAAVSTVTAASS